MKVLNVCHCLNDGEIGGGIQRQVQSLVAYQQESRPVGVLLSSKAGAFSRGINALGNVPWIALGLQSGKDLSPRAIRRAVRFLKPFHVVHVHSFNYVVVTAAILGGKPMIFTFHGLTHLRRALTFVDRIKFWTLSFSCNRIFRATTTVSAFMRERVLEHLSIAKPISVVPNITPALPQLADRSLLRQQLGVGAEDVLVLNYGRLVHNKRTEVVLQAAANMQTVPGRKVLFLVIGDGPERHYLEQLARDLGIGPIMSFLPLQENVFDYIDASDICVFPTAGEPFGIVALETLSLGKPTLVMTDGGGIVDVVSPIGNAAFVMRGAQEVCDWIAEAAHNVDLLSKYSEECCRRASDFEQEAVSAEYERIYRAAWERHTHGARRV